MSQDCLVIGYDTSEEQDHSCLVVIRKTKTSDRVLNVFYDAEARKIYNKLTDGRKKNGERRN